MCLCDGATEEEVEGRGTGWWGITTFAEEEAEEEEAEAEEGRSVDVFRVKFGRTDFDIRSARNELVSEEDMVVPFLDRGLADDVYLR